MRKILFVVDKLELKYFEFEDRVTNFWFIKEFLERGDEVCITTINRLFLQDAKAFAIGFDAYLEEGNLFYRKEQKQVLINDFDMAFFRPDPPVDMDYIEATYVFDFVDENKTMLINRPSSIRNFNEKLHLTYFPEFAPENIVTADASKIKEFLAQNKKAVIKPLNRCFGSGVFCLDEKDINLNTIIKTATNDGQTLVMVQEYLESAKSGDKRVLLLGDEVLEECVIKAPLPNDFKFSEHRDNYLRATSLTTREREFCREVAAKLNSMGLYLVGLDILEEKIIEINVTSPCYFIREINNLYDVKIHERIMNFFDSKFLREIFVGRKS